MTSPSNKIPFVYLAARSKFLEATPRDQPGYSRNCQTFTAAQQSRGDLPWLLGCVASGANQARPVPIRGTFWRDHPRCGPCHPKTRSADLSSGGQREVTGSDDGTTSAAGRLCRHRPTRLRRTCRLVEVIENIDEIRIRKIPPPSALKSTLSTEPVRPLSSPISRPVSASQMRTMLSQDAVTTRLPSG
jgi:hypothetical protein